MKTLRWEKKGEIPNDFRGVSMCKFGRKVSALLKILSNRVEQICINQCRALAGQL